MKQLPTDREKALAAIAAGYGREPTAAHPHCSCPTSSPRDCAAHKPKHKEGAK